ncbi:MAG: hypothetical protein WC781_00245 [Candidatus Pacearchaeota archaeon]|jgi:hypothetical protein
METQRSLNKKLENSREVSQAIELGRGNYEHLDDRFGDAAQINNDMKELIKEIDEKYPFPEEVRKPDFYDVFRESGKVVYEGSKKIYDNLYHAVLGAVQAPFVFPTFLRKSGEMSDIVDKLRGQWIRDSSGNLDYRREATDLDQYNFFGASSGILFTGLGLAGAVVGFTPFIPVAAVLLTTNLASGAYEIYRHSKDRVMNKNKILEEQINEELKEI